MTKMIHLLIILMIIGLFKPILLFSDTYAKIQNSNNIPIYEIRERGHVDEWIIAGPIAVDLFQEQSPDSSFLWGFRTDFLVNIGGEENAVLDEQTRRLVEKHLSACRDCKEALESLQALVQELQARLRRGLHPVGDHLAAGPLHPGKHLWVHPAHPTLALPLDLEPALDHPLADLDHPLAVDRFETAEQGVDVSRQHDAHLRRNSRAPGDDRLGTMGGVSHPMADEIVWRRSGVEEFDVLRTGRTWITHHLANNDGRSSHTADEIDRVIGGTLVVFIDRADSYPMESVG